MAMLCSHPWQKDHLLYLNIPLIQTKDSPGRIFSVGADSRSFPTTPSWRTGVKLYIRNFHVLEGWESKIFRVKMWIYHALTQRPRSKCNHHLLLYISLKKLQELGSWLHQSLACTILFHFLLPLLHNKLLFQQKHSVISVSQWHCVPMEELNWKKEPIG